jgi:hypothetical protein
LPDEHSSHRGIGIVASYFIGFPAWKAGDAERRVKAETLIDFRIDPKLDASPQAQTRIKGCIPGNPVVDAAIMNWGMGLGLVYNNALACLLLRLGRQSSCRLM